MDMEMETFCRTVFVPIVFLTLLNVYMAIKLSFLSSKKAKTKNQFKVLTGSEYEAFCNMRKIGARHLGQIDTIFSNIDMTIDFLKHSMESLVESKKSLKKQLVVLEKSLGLEFLEYSKRLKERAKNNASE